MTALALTLIGGGATPPHPPAWHKSYLTPPTYANLRPSPRPPPRGHRGEAMPVRVDDAKFEESSRVAGVCLATYTMRALERWRANLTDYDCVAIMIAVIAISSDRLLRTGFPPEYRKLSSKMDPALLSKVNISSIAHATGLNRETARRKVNDLIGQELLTRLEDGSIGFRQGLVQEERIRSQIRGQLSEIATVASQLMRMGVLVEE